MTATLDTAPIDTTPEVEVEAPAPDVTPDDLPRAAKAPRRRRASAGRDTGNAKNPQPAKRTPPARKARVDIAGGLAELYTMAGMGVLIIPSAPSKIDPSQTVTQAVGMAIVGGAADAGKAWAKLADENPAVRAALEKVLTVSAFGGLISAHVPILLAAGLATGTLPAMFAGLVGGDAE